MMNVKKFGMGCAVLMMLLSMNGMAQKAYEVNETFNKALRPAVAIVVNGGKAQITSALYEFLTKEGLPVRKGSVMKAENTRFVKISSDNMNVYAKVNTVDKALATQRVVIFLSRGAGDEVTYISSLEESSTINKLKDLLDKSFAPYVEDFMKKYNIDQQVKKLASSNKKLASLEKKLANLNMQIQKTQSAIEAQRLQVSQEQLTLDQMQGVAPKVGE